jgi:hypothetical protein
MAERIEVEVIVGLPKTAASALQMAMDIQGFKASQLARAYIMRCLIIDGWMQHPAAGKYPQVAAPAAPAAPAAKVA